MLFEFCLRLITSNVIAEWNKLLLLISVEKLYMSLA